MAAEDDTRNAFLTTQTTTQFFNGHSGLPGTGLAVHLIAGRRWKKNQIFQQYQRDAYMHDQWRGILRQCGQYPGPRLSEGCSGNNNGLGGEEKVDHYIRAIPSQVEFFIVIFFAFGYFIAGNILTLFVPATGTPITDGGLQFLISYETVMMAILGTFLLLRGWKLHHFGLSPGAGDIVQGMVVTFVAYVGINILWIAFSTLVTGAGEETAALVSPDLALMTVIIVSLLNPLFEEIFVCGYIITALKKTHGLAFAINVSVAVRLAYHLYQGTAGVITIIPIGVVYALWFSRTGRLWPLVISHAFFDFVGLLPYVAT